MREADLHRACTRWLRARGWLCVKMTTMGSYGNMGWPDVLAISSNGLVVFFEWKLPGRRLTSIQRAMHDRLAKHGQAVHVIHTLDELKGLLA